MLQSSVPSTSSTVCARRAIALSPFDRQPTGWRRTIARAALAALCATAVLAAGGARAQIVADGQRFHPIVAAQHMVVSQQALATKVGRQVLRGGGNAVDAAVATAFALAVTLPRAGNIGGGGFMVIRLADGTARAIDYRETAPAASERAMFLGPDGNASPELSRFSGLSVGVPGTVAGLTLAHARYGSGRLAFADLVAPAIRLARDGFTVTPDLAAALARPRIAERLSADPAMAPTFYPGGEALAVGATLRQPVLADTLQRIADHGAAGFYKGPVAEAIVAAVAAKGGRMTLADLAGYEAKDRDPIEASVGDLTVLSMPPPSSGGVHLVQILKILQARPEFAAAGLNGADAIHLMAEAARRAYADRAVYLGDPDFVDVPVAALTSDAYAQTLADGIDPNRATPSSEVSADPSALPSESTETTHFSIVDGDGNAVSNTYTLNFSFGVGFGTTAGFFLNNELDDFAAQPGVPNAYGLIGGEANAVAPRKRPLSSMTPTIVEQEGTLALVTGTPGGSRIITTTLQIILNVFAHDRDVMTATAAPRVHHQWLPDVLRIEEGLSPDTVRRLKARGHTVEVMSAMGAAQSIRVRDDGRLHGASDPRRPDGLAAGD